MKIGCDIVENKRLIDKSDKFIDMVLTEKEKKLYDGERFGSWRN